MIYSGHQRKFAKNFGEIFMERSSVTRKSYILAADKNGNGDWYD